MGLSKNKNKQSATSSGTDSSLGFGFNNGGYDSGFNNSGMDSSFSNQSGMGGGGSFGNSGGSFGGISSGNFGGVSNAGGASTGGSQFGQNVWGPQGQALAGMYGQAGNAFNQSMGMQNALNPMVMQQMAGVFNQSNPAWQQQMQGGAYSGLNSQDVFDTIKQSQQGGSQTGNLYSEMMGGRGNDYADAMKGQVLDDASKLKQQNLANLDSRAAAAGMSGSSGYHSNMAQQFDNIDKNAQNSLNQIGYNTFDKDLSNKLNIAQMADSNTLQREQMMTDMLGQKQSAMQSGLGFGGQMQNLAMGQYAPTQMGMQTAGQYANILGGPTVLGSGSNFQNQNMFNNSSQYGNQNNSTFGNQFANNGSNFFDMNNANSGSFGTTNQTGYDSGFNTGANMNFGNSNLSGTQTGKASGKGFGF